MQWKGQQDLDPLRAVALVSLNHIGAQGGSLKPASFHVSGWDLESTDLESTDRCVRDTAREAPVLHTNWPT